MQAAEKENYQNIRSSMQRTMPYGKDVVDCEMKFFYEACHIFSETLQITSLFSRVGLENLRNWEFSHSTLMFDKVLNLLIFVFTIERNCFFRYDH